MKLRPQFLALVLIEGLVTVASISFNLYHYERTSLAASGHSITSAVKLADISTTAAFAAALGYFFGGAYDRFANVFQNGEYFILAAVAITVVAFYGYKQLSARLSMRLEAI